VNLRGADLLSSIPLCINEFKSNSEGSGKGCMYSTVYQRGYNHRGYGQPTGLSSACPGGSNTSGLSVDQESELSFPGLFQRGQSPSTSWHPSAPVRYQSTGAAGLLALNGRTAGVRAAATNVASIRNPMFGEQREISFLQAGLPAHLQNSHCNNTVHASNTSPISSGAIGAASQGRRPARRSAHSSPIMPLSQPVVVPSYGPARKQTHTARAAVQPYRLPSPVSNGVSLLADVAVHASPMATTTAIAVPSTRPITTTVTATASSSSVLSTLRAINAAPQNSMAPVAVGMGPSLAPMQAAHVPLSFLPIGTSLPTVAVAVAPAPVSTGRSLFFGSQSARLASVSSITDATTSSPRTVLGLLQSLNQQHRYSPAAQPAVPATIFAAPTGVGRAPATTAATNLSYSPLPTPLSSSLVAATAISSPDTSPLVSLSSVSVSSPSSIGAVTPNTLPSTGYTPPATALSMLSVSAFPQLVRVSA